MKKTVFAATIAALFTANVQAETVGLYLGGQIWQSEASGIFGEKNILIDSNLKKEQQSSYFVAVEHPFTLLPNVRISSTTLDTTGKTTSTQESFSFDDGVFHIDVDIDVDVDASFSISYVDYTLYYELFDNDLFSFELGLTARDFDGAVTEAETTTTVTTSNDGALDAEEHPEHNHILTETTKTVAMGKIKTTEIVPMLYVATNISLPLTGLSIFAQGDFLLKDDHSLYNYQVGLSYGLLDQRKMDFNLTLGYRAVKIEFENVNNLYADIEFKGAFVGVIAHF
jgi:outer membrane protein